MGSQGWAGWCAIVNKNHMFIRVWVVPGLLQKVIKSLSIIPPRIPELKIRPFVGEIAIVTVTFLPRCPLDLPVYALFPLTALP